MKYTASVHLLSEKFIKHYPLSNYPELMYKAGCQYACLLIETHEGYTICIPFRSSIKHKNAFIFKGTIRSRQSRSGLDYSKMVIINDSSYLDLKQTAIIDQDEYNEMRKNLSKIVEQVHKYVQKYINHIKGTEPLHPKEYLRQYEYSTLPYFHDILNL